MPYKLIFIVSSEGNEVDPVYCNFCVFGACFSSQCYVCFINENLRMQVLVPIAGYFYFDSRHFFPFSVWMHLVFHPIFEKLFLQVEFRWVFPITLVLSEALKRHIIEVIEVFQFLEGLLEKYSQL